ncbi:methyltransferase domain-containing protein [Afipia clevelandensis]|uniref:Methyltransferase domain-containing protein n=1 Tax=Afipia clevelandensis ATCC 49720 TaxID=883079 RepID=K8P4F5_9BRAD|nr:methyltransferase domain-containing protein [Afipia clevelandensis]EKS35619.1 hypothetical protein HMPREF9696_01831 [Afipia clevelandensis ATCC 49720]
MRSVLLEKLRCPLTGHQLQVAAIESGVDIEKKAAVRTGILWSEQGGFWYPIINYVPIMLTFVTPLVTKFASEHASRVAALSGQPKLPNASPEQGERSVQTTFTEEWGGLEDDQLTFVYDQTELVALHRDVWIQQDDEERSSARTVLDVGCGFGKEAIVLSELYPNAQVIGADLNLAVVKAGERLVETTRVNPVVASLFHLPFSPESMDHVHCQGVLHHTWSTKAGFDAIAEKVASAGSLFVWVYAAEDRHVVKGVRGMLVRAYWSISHRIFRPVLSRAPSAVRSAAVHAISAAIHPIIKDRGRNRGRWKYANTVHGIRDAFTPMYAHEHGFNEVLEWFEAAGFSPKPQRPLKYRELFGSRLVGAGFIGRRPA